MTEQTLDEKVEGAIAIANLTNETMRVHAANKEAHLSTGIDIYDMPYSAMQSRMKALKGLTQALEANRTKVPRSGLDALTNAALALADDAQRAMVASLQELVFLLSPTHAIPNDDGTIRKLSTFLPSVGLPSYNACGPVFTRGVLVETVYEGVEKTQFTSVYLTTKAAIVRKCRDLPSVHVLKDNDEGIRIVAFHKDNLLRVGQVMAEWRSILHRTKNLGVNTDPSLDWRT